VDARSCSRGDAAISEGGRQQYDNVQIGRTGEGFQAQATSLGKEGKSLQIKGTINQSSLKPRQVQANKSETPTAPTPATSTVGNVAKTPLSTPSELNSPAMNTRSKSGPPSANARSHKPHRITDRIAMAVGELQQPRRKKPSKQASRLAKRIAKVKNKVHEAMTVLDRDTGKLLKYRQFM